MATDTYPDTYLELKSLEKSLQSELREFKQAANTNVNTFNLENALRKNLDSYINKLTKLNEDYIKNSKDIKYIIPEREYNRRLNEIQELKSNFAKIKESYDNIIDNKYRYKGSADVDQVENENTKNLNNKQYYEYSQKKLKDQDEKVEELIGYTKKGKELGNELKNELKNQNLLLDDVEKDVDKVQGNMARTRNKFENYIESSSQCWIMLVIVLEIISLICLILFW